MTSHSDFTSHRAMRGPGDLLAAIPALVGFYPQDSVVLVGFQRSDHPDSGGQSTDDAAHETRKNPTSTTGRPLVIDANGGAQPQGLISRDWLEVGPVLRLDIKDMRLLADAGQALRDIDVELVLAFVIGDTDTCNDYGVFEVMLNAASCEEIDIVAAWHAHEIVTGARYSLIFAAQDHLPDDTAYKDLWLGGTIPLVAASPVMQKLIESGELPEINRDDAIGYFRTSSDYLPDDYDALASNAAWIEAVAQADPGVLEGELRIMNSILRRLTQGAVSNETDLLPDDEPSSVAENAATSINARRYATATMPTPGAETITWMATWMARTWLRDCALAVLLRHAETARTLMYEIATSHSGIVRANALTVYAALALGGTSVFRVPVALEAALKEIPDHRLAHLIKLGYQRGCGEAVLETMAVGAETTLAECGVSMKVFEDIVRPRGLGGEKPGGCEAA